MEWVLAAIAAAVIIAVVVVAVRRRGPSAPAEKAAPTEERVRPTVAEFHVVGDAARVHFEVPLGEGIDPVLADLLGREAIEVVREKRHSLPIADVGKVVALGRRHGEWVEVSTITLDTPGTLPPPLVPELIPHARRADFDVFDRLGKIPEQHPEVDPRPRAEELPTIGTELRLPAAAEAALRSQGIDPQRAGAGEIVLGMMRGGGYRLDRIGPSTYRATRAGQHSFVRVVEHEPGDHPELDEQEIRRFVVDFGSSGSDRGLLITEKYSPFEVYDRERRDRRIRFITRERLQAFVDALSL